MPLAVAGPGPQLDEEKEKKEGNNGSSIGGPSCTGGDSNAVLEVTKGAARAAASDAGLPSFKVDAVAGVAELAPSTEQV